MQQFIFSKDDLNGILKNLITTGEKWDGYESTKNIAEYWQKIISGKGHDDILLSLKSSESQEAKTQKVRLYNSRTKSVANKIINQIKEVYKSDNIYSEIYYTEKSESNADNVKSIQSALNNFCGKKSVRQWLRERYLRLNCIDPNAHVVIGFTQDEKGKNKYYPIEVRSKDILSKQYINGTLQYLAFVEKVTAKVVKDGKVKTLPAFKYWIFGHNDVILYHKVPSGGTGIGIPVDITQAVEYHNHEAVSYSWFYSDYEIKSVQVPAPCVGYVPNPEDDDRTFESIMYAAKELFNELIWKKASYDLHMTLHGIAQKFAFVPSCKWENKELGLKCDQGRLTNGDPCGQCGGSGQMPFHTSEQDIITIALPENGNTELLDLSKLIYYQEIPKTIIEMTRDAVREMEVAIPLAVFNRSIVDKGDLVRVETATKIRDDNNSTNNVLYEFGLADADYYKTCVLQIAIYENKYQDDLVIDYAYPQDFNLESLSELFFQAKEAMASGQPAVVKGKINGKIISKLCIDNKSAIHNYEAREYWKPFSDMSQAALVPEFDKSKILFIYFDQIFRKLEGVTYKNTEGTEVSFAQLPREKQEEYINTEVDIYFDRYKAAKDAAPPIRVPRNV